MFLPIGLTDETYLGGPEAALKGGRHLLDKALGVGALEVRGKAAGRVRLHLVPDASARSLSGFVRRTVTPGAVILTDRWRRYASLPDLGCQHRPRTQGLPERAGKLLPHIHRVLGNFKTWLGGTHHGVGHDHLQAYLDEFAARFNRRRTPMAAFQTLLGPPSGIHGPLAYDMLYRSESTRSAVLVFPRPVRCPLQDQRVGAQLPSARGPTRTFGPCF